MKSFHFDFGDSVNGVIGMCARVTAETAEEAVLILQDRLSQLEDGCIEVAADDPESGIEYINVYWNEPKITVAHIDEVNDPATGEYGEDAESRASRPARKN